LNNLESPDDVPPQILMDLSQWFMERRFLKLFAKNLYKTMFLRVWPIETPGTSFE